MISSSKNFFVRICEVRETVTLLVTVSEVLYGDVYVYDNVRQQNRNRL